MELQKIENRAFGPGEKVELDGKSFFNCTFRSCEIVYAGGETLWRCVTWHDCNFKFVGPAKWTVQVLLTLGCVISPPPRQTISCTLIAFENLN